MRRVERWIFSSGSAERLAALRIGLCSVLALRLTRTVYVHLAAQPRALFRPLSFMKFFSAMPPRLPVLIVQIIGVAAAAAAAFGWRTRATLPLAWGAGVFLNGMTTSLGKVVHNDVLLLLCLFPLVFAASADVWSLDSRTGRTHRGDPSRYGWPVNTAMIVVAGAYFFAGFAKLVNSGPGWVTGGNMRWILYIASDARPVPNSLALFIAEHTWLAHLVAGGSLLMELTLPIVLFWKRARPVYIAAAAIFHIGIWLTIGLDYWPQPMTVGIVLIDWPAVVARVRLARARPAISPG